MLAATIALTGCGGDVVAPADASLQLVLTATSVTAASQGMTFTLQVTNASDAPATIDLGTGNGAFSPIVTDGGGVTVWNYPGFVGFTDLPDEGLILPAGGTASFAVTWDLRDNAGQRVAPGTYYVTGRLMGASGQVAVESDAVAVRVF